MILLRDISLHFGQQIIFDAVSCNFTEKQRIGLVGRNGAGKSTLLKVIAGLQSIDSGSITIERRKKIAYMPQEVVLNSDKTVFDETRSALPELITLEQECAQLEQRMAHHTDADLLERYAIVQEQLQAFDTRTIKREIESILTGLGFSTEQMAQPVNTLSVGWKMRIVLAQLLLQKADFYLFDEPTNHLDIVTKEWFFNFLKHSNAGFLLVSHDRYFLDNICQIIIDVERGALTWYRGNYTAFLEQKEAHRQALESAAQRQQKEIARKQATIDRFKASASRAKQAQSMMKQLEKIDIIEIEPELPTIHFSFPEPPRSGSTVLYIQKLSYAFTTHKIFKDVSFQLNRGEKAAIIAPNGTGKTTLFNLIAEKYPLQEGRIIQGTNVISALFEQDQTRALNPKNTLLEEVLSGCPNTPEKTIRSFLGSFLFKGDEVTKKVVSMLSGGERNRLAMVKVLLKNANLLLLDEPTNHLDLYAKEILLQALQQYQGTILFVSHDQDFLNKLATRIIELTPTGVNSYSGNYDAYIYFKKQEQASTSEPSRSTSPQIITAKPVEIYNNKDLYMRRKECASLENKIARLEQEIEALSLKLTDYDYGTPAYQEIERTLLRTQQSLQDTMQRWEAMIEHV